MRSQRRELWNRSAECMPERALSRTRRTGPLPALPSASSLTRRKSFPSLPWTWVYLSGRREGCSQRGPSAFSVWYDSWARTSHCLPSPCKTRNLVGRRPEPEIFPSPWLKFICLLVCFPGSSWHAIYNGKVLRNIALRVHLCHSAWHSLFHSQEGEDGQHFMSRNDFI